MADPVNFILKCVGRLPTDTNESFGCYARRRMLVVFTLHLLYCHYSEHLFSIVILFRCNNFNTIVSQLLLYVSRIFLYKNQTNLRTATVWRLAMLHLYKNMRIKKKNLNCTKIEQPCSRPHTFATTTSLNVRFSPKISIRHLCPSTAGPLHPVQ